MGIGLLGWELVTTGDELHKYLCINYANVNLSFVARLHIV